MPKPTMVHKSIRRAVATLVGSPAAVIKIIPAKTRRIGATITDIVKRKLMMLLIRPVNVVLPSGFSIPIITGGGAPAGAEQAPASQFKLQQSALTEQVFGTASDATHPVPLTSIHVFLTTLFPSASLHLASIL